VLETGYVGPRFYDGGMSTATTSLSSKERLDVLFAEMEELAGQRNAIDSRLVEIAAEIDGDGIWGATGFDRCRRWWPGSWASARTPRRPS
jgi:hypothetical protein